MPCENRAFFRSIQDNNMGTTLTLPTLATGIIYKHTCKSTGKSYIGKTIQKLSQRMAKPYYSHFDNALKKYGWGDFETETLGVYPVECLGTMEKIFIAKYNTYESGYNSTTGGEGHYILSEESRNKISKALSIPIYQYNLGGKFVKKHNSISEAARNVGCSSGEISQVAKKQYGRKSAGGYIWRYDKDENVKYKKEISQKDKDKITIHQFTKDGRFIATFKGIRVASRATNIAHNSISDCAKGKYNTAGGYKWRYKNG